jgi:hypothetical protein
MKVVSLEPTLGRSNVAADCRPRDAELPLEVADRDRARRCVEKRREDLRLAVLAVTGAGPAAAPRVAKIACRRSSSPDTQTPAPPRRTTRSPSGRRNVSIDGRLYRTTRLVSLSSPAIGGTVAGPVSVSSRRVMDACRLSSGTTTAMAPNLRRRWSRPAASPREATTQRFVEDNLETLRGGAP